MEILDCVEIYFENKFDKYKKGAVKKPGPIDCLGTGNPSLLIKASL